MRISDWSSDVGSSDLKTVRDAVAHADMLLLDQWALHRAHELQAQISAAYERYDFAEVVQRLNNFCTVDMGSIYLDVTKDRLYTMQQQALGRRSADRKSTRLNSSQ